MTYYGYILRSERTGRFYVGQSKNYIERLVLHNAGRVISTRHGRPWKLMFVISFNTRSEARQWESRTKKRKSRAYIDALISTAPYREDVGN